ncbi:hypothetical protein GCM10016455_05850 [Aliiroseovarius zhejiangensis]|uniref:Uncharacterized protein n=1 Tax=Aliiroseovarius zhejiangensis TaxID=1632025 RepID=A0ABQ3IN74_9RHOB|nr:J domain-containing protein [Aliiroseovarius zhejiangensis]GHE88550.1 hypothetical protein GCM10016455_05850 [Aliiroseovarius zhejiangensis]
MTQAYPLQWPAHVSRTRPAARRYSRFDVTPDRARRELLREAELMGRHVVISTNIELRRDGEPYANRRAPEDPGVAVYFMRKKQQVCLACDKHPEVWENMRAIGKTLEAMRGIERWGTSELLDQAFKGFTALPPPDQMSPIVTPAPSNWWDVLGVSPDASWAVIKGAHRALVMEAGGGTVELNAAYDAARKEKGQ